MRYTTIPHLVDAIAFTGNNDKEIEDFSGCQIKYGMMQNEILVTPSSGQYALGINDFVVKDTFGKISVVSNRLFRKMYREV